MLDLKKDGKQMKILNAKKDDVYAISKLWNACFDEDSVEWRDWYFENIYSADNVIMAKESDKLISMVHMNPYSMMLRYAKINAFALSGVSTYEEHRGQGYAGELIKHALKKAYAQGYEFSFLYPFKYEYYEKFGYKLSYHKYEYYGKYLESSAAEIKECDRFSLEVFADIYNKFVNGKNGYVVRNSGFYTKHIKQLECDGNKIVCFIIKGKRGYYCIDKQGKKIEEMAYEGDLQHAINEICCYEKKDIVFENLFKHNKLNGVKEPHCMGRVVSVDKIFMNMRLKDLDIKLKITDDIIEENNGVWQIQSYNGQTNIGKVKAEPDYIIDISTLAPIITGTNIERDKNAHLIQSILFKGTDAFIYEVC